jgi:kynurenine formamidase
MSLFPYKILDLTHTLEENIPTWDGECGFAHQIKWDYPDCSSEVKFRVQHIKMHAGIGTHIDAPAHCVLGGATVDELQISDLIAPCYRIDVSGKAHERYSVTVEDILTFEKEYGTINPGCFVMIRTGWERFWKEPERYRNNHLFPSVSKEAAKLLLNRQTVGLGIDTLSPDRPEDGYPVHEAFLGLGKYIIENASGLNELPPVGSFLLALPIKTKKGTEAPIRLIAFIKTE